MPSSSWICTNNSKTMLLRLVHPGGHVELHDRPVTAAEIMWRNPRCCVAHPFVFQQPWAIVEPDTVLMLGQKFYVVPISSVRKLQMLSPNHSPSPSSEITTISSSVNEIRNAQSCKEEKEDDGKIFTCCIFKKKSTAKQSKQHAKNEECEISEIRSNANDKNGGLSYHNFFAGLFNGVKTRESVNDVTDETKTSSSSTNLRDSSSNRRTRRRNKDSTGKGLRGGSPKKAWSCEQWEPSLHSITEE